MSYHGTLRGKFLLPVQTRYANLTPDTNPAVKGGQGHQYSEYCKELGTNYATLVYMHV